MKHILIISYVPPYNRQGYDLASCLRSAGYEVCLLQMNGTSDPSNGVIGIKCYKPKGIFHKLIMAVNFAKFAAHSLFRRKQIIVCVGKPMLLLGGICHFLFGSRLVWYSLEYGKLDRVARFVYNHCVSAYIDVEENRMRAIFEEYGAKKNSLVCYNMPHLHNSSVAGGKLRSYLKRVHGICENVKLVIYAGSYQEYACLENLVSASRQFPENVKLVLMAFGLPAGLVAASDNCFVVYPVSGDEFYDWLADADCALLPYESENDFNVLNCSPQKIFDCYLAGVPYIASDRPIVSKVLACSNKVGCICDFTDVNDILNKIAMMIDAKASVAGTMRKLHLEKFNYSELKVALVRLMKGCWAS